MRTIEEIKDRCVIDESGHWIWSGSASADGTCRIWYPEVKTGKMLSGTGLRAAWVLANNKDIPKGHRAYSICRERLCLNPDHIRCGTCAEIGKFWAKVGVFDRCTIIRRIKGRMSSRQFVKLTEEQIEDVKTGQLSNSEYAKKHGTSTRYISKIARGRVVAYEPVGGMFSGLIAANSSIRRAA